MQNVLLLPCARAHTREWRSTGEGSVGQGAAWGSVEWPGTGKDGELGRRGAGRAPTTAAWGTVDSELGSGESVRERGSSGRERGRARGFYRGRGERRGRRGGTTGRQWPSMAAINAIEGERTWGRERGSLRRFLVQGRRTVAVGVGHGARAPGGSGDWKEGGRPGWGPPVGERGTGAWGARAGNLVGLGWAEFGLAE
jgi:hypothetical protein